MSQTLQERKALAQFRALDLDDNGYIERSDYEQTVDRILREFAVAAESPEGGRLRAEYLLLFDRACSRLDVDNDGRISADEWLASVSGSVGRSSGRAMRPVAMAVVAVCDGDGDGDLSVDEVRRFLITIGTRPEQAEAAAERLDIQHTGIVHGADFVQAIQDFYASDDPQAPGSGLFGSV